MRLNPTQSPRLISRVSHDLYGNHLKSQVTDAELKAHASLIDKYYTKQMNKPLGISELIALFETLTGAILWWCLPSPATAINEITTLCELAQVQVSRTSSFGNRDKEETKKRTEGAMAWLQVLAGLGGATSCLSDAVSRQEKEMKDLSLTKKISLTIASFLSSVFMIFGSGEKAITATSAQKNKHSKESTNIRINGNSDKRCAAEWFAMSLLPWFSRFKPFKTALDYLIIYGALREGVTHFLTDGVSMVFNNKVIELDKKFKGLLKTVFLTNGKNKIVPWPFNNKWFLGSGDDINNQGKVEASSKGIRSKFLLPVLRFLGCNPPVCYLNKNGNIVSEFYDNNEAITKPSADREVAIANEVAKAQILQQQEVSQFASSPL